MNNSPSPKITLIQPTDCVGNSRVDINNNFTTLSGALVDLFNKPRIATSSTSGAMRVGAGLLNVLGDSELVRVDVDGYSIEIVNNQLKVNPDSLTRFLNLSGGALTGPLTIVEGVNRGLSIGGEADPEYKLKVAGKTKLLGDTFLPARLGSSFFIQNGQGTGDASYTSYSSVLRVGSIALRDPSEMSTATIILDSTRGIVLTKNEIRVGSLSIDGVNNRIQQLNIGQRIGIWAGNSERLCIHPNGSVTIGTTLSSSYKFQVDGVAQVTESIETKTPNQSDRSTRVATTEFVRTAVDVVGSDFTKYLPLSGGELIGPLKAPRLQTSYFNLGSANSEFAHVLDIKGSTIIQVSRPTEAVKIVQTGVGSALIVNNGTDTKFTVTKDGALFADGESKFRSVKVTAGAPTQGDNSLVGLSFQTDANTGIFSKKDGSVSVYGNGIELMTFEGSVDGFTNTTSSIQITAQGNISVLATPISAKHVTTKDFVENAISSSIGLIDFTPYTLRSESIFTSGGSVNGILSLNTTPVSSAHVVNLSAMQGAINALNITTKLPLSGNSTITGSVTATKNIVSTGAVMLSGIPLVDNQAATKRYVDTYGLPLGAIIMWSGVDIPQTFALCDGGVHNGVQTPNLRERFIMGATNATTIGTTGGSSSLTTSTNGAHYHDGFVDITSINNNQSVKFLTDAQDPQNINYKGHTHSIKSDGAHNHTISNSLPPYYQLAYIMKVGF